MRMLRRSKKSLTVGQRAFVAIFFIIIAILILDKRPFLTLAIEIYLLPYIIAAYKTRKRMWLDIVLQNIFFGFTIIGWIRCFKFARKPDLPDPMAIWSEEPLKGILAQNLDQAEEKGTMECMAKWDYKFQGLSYSLMQALRNAHASNLSARSKKRAKFHIRSAIKCINFLNSGDSAEVQEEEISPLTAILEKRRRYWTAIASGIGRIVLPSTCKYFESLLQSGSDMFHPSCTDSQCAWEGPG
jgi:hypothetical protein